MPAEADQVLDFRLAAVGPVVDVVAIEGVTLGAAGERTALVDHPEGTLERRRDRPRLSADRKRLPLVLEDADDARVACEPSDRRRRYRLAVFELGAPGRFRGNG